MAKKTNDSKDQDKKKLPYIHFYPGIWREDMKVQSLSNTAKHIWFETLLIMNGADKRGMLSINNKPISIALHAKWVGYTVQETQSAIDEWFNMGVAYRDSSGIIFNKRLVEDTQKYEIRVADGKKGGNPDLKKDKKDNHQVNPIVNPLDNPIVKLNGNVNVFGNSNGNEQGINSEKKENIVDNKLSTHPDKPGNECGLNNLIEKETKHLKVNPEKKKTENEFITRFNEIKGAKEKPALYKLSPALKIILSNRLKDYSAEQILTAVQNCKNDKYHIENPKFLTPAFILNAEKLEKYLNCGKEPDGTPAKHIHVPSRLIQDKLDMLKRNQVRDAKFNARRQTLVDEEDHSLN